jgi:hypothetical protein
VLAACALVGCGPSDTTPAGEPTEAISSTPSTGSSVETPEPEQGSSRDTAEPDAPGLIDEDTGEVITPRAVPQWDLDSRASAAAAGEAVMRAFARPDRHHDSWWAEIEPLLSSEAQIDYAYVDPANIPASQITAEPTLAEDSSPYIAHVQVPTDVGTYTVLLSRQNANAPWLAERITPPEADS